MTLHQAPYPYDCDRTFKYTFVSVGRKRISKAVIFSKTPLENVYNIGFGDLRHDGSIDDKVVSNNGDIAKVIVTITKIIQEFTTEHPNINVMFLGSDTIRTTFYQRILNTYYELFSKEFVITAIIKSGSGYDEVQFEPGFSIRYFAFFIRKIH